MAPRGHALPQAATESAREARKSFFCELCQKGYARMNDFEAHEGSYDHQHRKRLKEMKQLTKDPNAASKAERERKANEEAGLKSINLNLPSSGATGGGGPTGKKKPVFKSTLQPHNAAALGVGPAAPVTAPSITNDVDMADANDAAEPWLKECIKLALEPAAAQLVDSRADRYDPRFPTFLTRCPYPECGNGPCRHADRSRSDPRLRRHLADLLRSRGLPAKGTNESWEDFRQRSVVVAADVATG